MTLTGFKHTAATMSRKQRLDTNGIAVPQFHDVMSTSRRSNLRASHVSYEDLQNPPSDGRSQRSESAGGRVFQVIDPNEIPPMNEELTHDTNNANDLGPISPQNDDVPANPAEATTCLN